MSVAASLQNTAVKSQPLTPWAHRGLLLQRKCACGSPTSSLSGECAECAGKKLQRSSLSIGPSGDCFEQEADRVADAVVAGKTASLSLSSVPTGNVQREDAPKEKTAEEKFKEAGGKFLEALLKTPLGKDLQKAVEQDKLVKGAAELGKDIAAPFISTLPGKIITGVAAAGAVAALAAEYKKLPHKELPAQIPEIPLDGLTPGLSVQITYKGPMDQPTEAMVSFKYSEQASKGVGDKKDGPNAVEKYRAETARLAAADAKFRAGMTYKPGSPEDLRQKAEQGDEKRAVAKFAGGPDLDAMFKKYPGLKSPQPQPGEQLEMPKRSFGFTPPEFLGDQLKYKLPSEPSEQKKKEDEPALQRKNAGATTEAMAHDAAPPIVDEVLHSPGQPLDAATRAFMEPRFGHDFSQVRVHSGATAEQSAREVNANAYTVGPNIVFGAGRFAPRTHEGRRLIAHELTHVVQQTRRVAGFPGQSTPGNLQRKPEAKEAKKKFKPGDCVRVNAVRLTLPNVPWGEPGYKVITQVGTEKGLNSLLKVERLLPGTDEYPRTPGVYEFTVLADDGKVKAGVGGGKLTGVADSVYVDFESCPAAHAPESPGAKAAAKTVVSAKDIVEKTYMVCGEFNWDVAWETSARSGYLVQEIRGDRFVHMCNSAFDVDHQTSLHPHYWEAWTVNSSGAAVPGGTSDDRWSFSFVPKRSGKWRTIGKVHWVAALDPEAGFAKNTVALAHDLLATTKQPTNLGPPLLVRQAGGEWNCCGSDQTHTPLPDTKVP